MSYDIPKRLFKYQPYTIWSLDNLKNRQIRFSRPIEFNDPFDCAITPLISEPTQDEWNQVFEEFRSKSRDKEAIDLKYLSDRIPNEEFKKDSRIGFKKAFEEQKAITLNNRGVACFSESLDSLLMWSHYTDGHRGFCLEFDTKYEPFNKTFPVDYSDDIPSINPTKVFREDIGGDFIDLLRTKSKGWSYEKEWRIMHKEPNIQYGIDEASLVGIYYGCAMLDVHKQIISSLFSGTRTRFYELHKVEDKFKIRPKEC
jgi:hypothetical protein